jgi:hypothetical protein
MVSTLMQQIDQPSDQFEGCYCPAGSASLIALKRGHSCTSTAASNEINRTNKTVNIFNFTIYLGLVSDDATAFSTANARNQWAGIALSV